MPTSLKLRNRAPRTRPETLATVVTWVFWIAVAATVTTVIRTLTGQGPGCTTPAADSVIPACPLSYDNTSSQTEQPDSLN